MILNAVSFEVLALDQDEAEKHFSTGMDFNKQRRFPEAMKELTRAVELNLESNKFHQALFLTYTQNREGLKAIRLYQELVAKNPKSPALHYWLGRLYMEGSKLADSAAEFKMASQLSPKDEHPLISLGHATYRLGRDSEALAAYQAANKLTPHLAVIHTGLGNVYYNRKEYRPARREYEEALRLDPSFEEARYNLSLIYEKQGEIELAIKEWKYLLDADPNESKIRAKLAMVYFERGQYRDAVREYALLSQINQRSSDVYFMLGKSEVLLAGESQDPQERDELKESAISAFQHVLDFDSDHLEAKKYLDRLLKLKPAVKKKKESAATN